MKSAITATELQTLLRSAGLPGEVVDDAARGIGAESSVGDIRFAVQALNCQGAPRACSTLMFYAHFDLGRPAGPRDFEAVNRFNDGQVFGRAYVRKDRDQVGVDYVVELDGGVTPDHLARNVDRWRKVVTEFLRKVSASTPTS
ncbi:MAG: YbjN domain-containing protein [Parvularculaceae bacterium]|nr:YbjN domain-containing protein [Parvularculaceae bacterium]